MFTPKVRYLEGIRGIAALVVFLYHYFLAFSPGLITGYPEHAMYVAETKLALSPLNVFWNGSFAVTVFFVLSGMVLSLKFFSGDTDNPKSAALRRWFRLMPPVLVSALTGWLLLSAGCFRNVDAAELVKYPGWLSSLWRINPSLWSSFSEGIYGALTGGAEPKYNPVLWTMNMEFFGSFLVFAVLVLAGSTGKRGLIYLVLAVLLWKSMLLAFILGLALADFTCNSERKQLPVYVSLLLILAGLYLGGYRDEPGQHAWNWLSESSWKPKASQLYILGAALLLTGISQWNFAKSLLEKKPLLLMGRLSFSFYLLHVLFLGSAASGMFLFFSRCGLDNFTTVALVIFCSFSCLLLLSFLYERWIDKPSIAFSEWIYRKYFAKEMRLEM